MTFLGKQCCEFIDPVVTMGTFDGVHLGHQKLIKALVEKAKEKKTKSIVISYYKHPLETIHRKTFPYLLTEKSLKEELFKAQGVDCVLFLNFTPEMAAMGPDDFIKKIIKGELKANDLIVGYDTHFGCNRTGDFKYLNDNRDRLGIDVELVEPFKLDNRIVSSSLIRDFVREGNMKLAEKYLGRKYSLIGDIVSGKKIGRKIGFPTINVHPGDINKLIPAIGVYVTQVKIKDKTYCGVTNVGYSPTLKNVTHREIETFILNFDCDIYGEEVEVIFHWKLRDEKYFPDKKQLIATIEADVKRTKEYFAI